MNQSQYYRLASSLPKISRRYRYLLPSFDLMIIFLSFKLFQEGILLSLLGSILLAIISFHAFCILHDCGHTSFSKYKIENQIVGTINSILCLIPYLAWTQIHEKHHLYTGNINDDPTMKIVRSIRTSKSLICQFLNFVWKNHIPLLGFLQFIVMWQYPFKVHGIRNKVLAFLSLSVTIIPVCTLIYFYPNLMINILLSFIIYLFLIEWINFPHHLELGEGWEQKGRITPWNQVQATRSCSYPMWAEKIISLNFNMHVEHHLFPGIPWYQLPIIRNKLKELEYSDSELYIHRSSNLDWNAKARKEDFYTVMTSSRPN